MIGGSSFRGGVDDVVARAQELERRGFATMWIAHVFGHDAIALAAIAGRATRRIGLGTAVVPTQPRHPVALTQQALTASAACGGERFTLGIGLSHPAVIEGMYGLSYEGRASHMRAYLAVLGPLLRGERADFEGDELRVHAALAVAGARRVPVVVAALGPRMLELAGREADGTILWMAGPRAIEHHVAPIVRAAARSAGRPAPRIVAGMHIALTQDAAAAREHVGKLVAMYAQMPSYRRLVEIEGSVAPEALALVGDETALDAGLARLRDIGVSDFEASLVAVDEGAQARTLDYLASRVDAFAM